MKIYTVVDVQCGVAVDAQSFFDLDEAKRHFRTLSSSRNLDEDDVQLFEQEMHPNGKQYAVGQHKKS